MSFNFSPIVVSGTTTLGSIITQAFTAVFTVVFKPLGSDSLITSDGKTFKVRET